MRAATSLRRADDMRQRKALIAGVVVVAILSALDVTLTDRFLRLGVPEGNAMMRGLVGSWRIVTVKAALVAAVGWRAVFRPTFTLLCGVWFAVGVYAVTAYVNAAVIVSVSHR